MERGKRIVEATVRSENGVLFFKHVHMAAGTTLCKVASLNTKVHIHKPKKEANPWDNKCSPYNFGSCAIGGMSISAQRQLVVDYPGYFLASNGPMPDDLLISESGSMGMAWITILRHPWERIVSTFRTWKRTMENLSSENGPKNLGEKIVSSTFYRQHSSNAALCKRYYAAKNVTFYEWIQEYPDNWMVRTFAGHSAFWRKSPMDRSDLGRASRNLHIFSLVGIMPLLQESIFLTKELFGWDITDMDEHRVPSLIPKHGTTDRKSVV